MPSPADAWTAAMLGLWNAGLWLLKLVLNIEDAVRELWKVGIYAESAMGCTGPVVKLALRNLEKAKAVLREGGYL